MSANRKLQAEIDKVLKKVEEGTEIFDDIWSKVYTAGQQSLKEKYEGDLKKEIKKLQRLRDQIKTWISSGDVKDKSQLVESRKLIESKMEQFKICEKDTKTKAYSKEGLARDSRMDPKEQEKEEKRCWLNESIERLSELVDTIELDLEKVSAGRGKSKNKEQIEKLENRIKKNKWHIARLEQILRLLDGDDLDPSLLDDIKDGVDYYIESAVDDDGALGIEDEFDIYEDLQLDLISTSIQETKDEDDNNAADSPTPTSGEAISANSDDKGDESEPGFKKSSLPPTQQVVLSLGKVQPPRPVVPAKQPPKTSPVVTPPAPAPLKQLYTATNPPIPMLPLNVKGNVVQPIQQNPLRLEKKMNEKTSSEDQPKEVLKRIDVRDEKYMKVDSQASSWTHAATQMTQPQTIGSENVSFSNQFSPSITPVYNTSTSGVGGQQLLQSIGGPTSSALGQTIPANNMSQSFLPSQQPSNHFPSASSSISTSLYNNNNGYRIGNAPLSPEIMTALVALKHSMQYSESERSQSFIPKNPYMGHPSFPTHTANVIENPLLFEKLPIDSLFLTFYYQQGSYQQYLAAKQLKKQSWRYHKKYMTWFQRHDEPKTTTDDYEEGTYVYFDYENGWCPRLKSEFKFEYSFLEDELQGK